MTEALGDAVAALIGTIIVTAAQTAVVITICKLML